jgi:hypothetical protein
MRAWLTIFVVFGICAYSGVSFAFPRHSFFEQPAAGPAGVSARAGGGGIYGTGGATDYGIKCSHCHINNNNQQGHLTMNVVPTPAFQSVGGADAYKPGQTYAITVTMMGEHLGLANTAMTGNINQMAFTVEDNATGKLAGVLTSDEGKSSSSCTVADPYPKTYNGGVTNPSDTSKTTIVFGTCHAVLGLPGQARTQWKFSWTAPASGDLTIFVGAVDGDTDGKSSLDDDAIELSIPLKKGS